MLVYRDHEVRIRVVGHVCEEFCALDQFVQHSPNLVDVDGALSVRVFRVFASMKEFQRRIPQRANEVAIRRSIREIGAAKRTKHSKIEENEMTVGTETNVVRLNVAVAEASLVQIVGGHAQLSQSLPNSCIAERPGCDLGAQVEPLYVLHLQVGRLALVRRCLSATIDLHTVSACVVRQVNFAMLSSLWTSCSAA